MNMHADMACKRCNGTRYVPSGISSAVLPTKSGVVLKTEATVPIQMPCPVCNAGMKADDRH